jgi:hypothetical protein
VFGFAQRGIQFTFVVIIAAHLRKASKNRAMLLQRPAEPITAGAYLHFALGKLRRYTVCVQKPPAFRNQ